MATWTNIGDEFLEPGKPVRSVDGLALRDNPIAIAEGASGAPKVTENAMNPNSIHGDRLRTGTVTATQLADGTGERDWVLARTAAATTGALGTYAFLGVSSSATAISAGATYAGSSLFYTGIQLADSGSSVDWDSNSSGAPSGTWRAVGKSGNKAGYFAATMFFRIA